VVLVNLKNPRQKVVFGKINDHWGLEKFHCSPIPKFWYKLHFMSTLLSEAPFMHPHEDDD
jgi:hypothetical protein